MLEPDDAGETVLFIKVEPAVDGVGVARFEEAGAGDGMGRETVSDFENGGTAFTDIGFGMVVTILDLVVTLALGEVEGATERHTASFREKGWNDTISLPILIVKTHKEGRIPPPAKAGSPLRHVLWVPAYQGHAFHECLCGDQPIEQVAVVERKRRDECRMLKRDREQSKSVEGEIVPNVGSERTAQR